MIQSIFNEKVTIKRRADIGTVTRDSLNNPVYGAPTASWTSVYTNMPARLAFGRKPIDFAQIGERVTPDGVMYFQKDKDVRPEDRVLTATGIEYTIISVVNGYVTSKVVDHKEAILQLP